MRRQQRYDVIVIGAGTAGLVAATRLAQRGASVCVVARGFGSTHLAPGTIDVLGHTPQLVDSPSRSLAAFTTERSDHPYALVGGDVLAEAVDWFVATAADGPLPGYAYTGSLERNLLLPTAVGSLKPSALVPVTFAGGDSSKLGTVAVVGTPVLRDFHPKLCAANLAAAAIDARAVSIDVELDRADSSTLGLARRLEEPGWRAAFCAQLAALIGGADQVGLPAVLGVKDPRAVFDDLQARLGRPVFEIPSLPPSVPGMRLFEILHHALRAAGGRIAIGAGVVAHERSGDRIASIDTATAGSPTTYAADWFVLASGGFHSGAITLDSHWHTRETVFDLPLRGVPAPGEPRFAPSYFDEQPLARAGIAVDADLRPDGAANVVVAGAALPGAAPWREGSGEGIALATGFKAARVVAATRPQETLA